jgi:hypothetical protein
MESLLTLRKGKLVENKLLFRIQLDVALKRLSTEVNDMEEVMFWGKVSGMTSDYFVALGFSLSG